MEPDGAPGVVLDSLAEKYNFVGVPTGGKGGGEITLLNGWDILVPLGAPGHSWGLLGIPGSP